MNDLVTPSCLESLAESFFDVTFTTMIRIMALFPHPPQFNVERSHIFEETHVLPGLIFIEF